MEKIKEYLNTLAEEDDTLREIVELISKSLNADNVDINGIDEYLEKELKKIESQTLPNV